MISTDVPAYGLWPLVIINVAIFVVFALSFYKPRTARDWRSFGAFFAFLVALFTEMYGFPLTIYLLSGWLLNRYPGIDLFSHNTGHLWETLLGWKGDPHFTWMHWLSEGLIAGGFILIGSAWKVLYRAQRNHSVASEGPYTRIRHPQYAGFIMILLGFLFQWPTLITLIMFPFLVFMYFRLSRREEQESLAEFGETYAKYAAQTPAFLPRMLPIGTSEDSHLNASFMIEKMMKIELLHIDDCPSWQNGLRNLEVALQDEGIAGTVELVKVTDNADANRLKFLGSPSFHIDGQDLWPEERESYSLSCRIYHTPQGLKGYPTISMLRDALRKFIEV